MSLPRIWKEVVGSSGLRAGEPENRVAQRLGEVHRLHVASQRQGDAVVMRDVDVLGADDGVLPAHAEHVAESDEGV
jgi:hypothetical protein